MLLVTSAMQLRLLSTGRYYILTSVVTFRSLHVSSACLFADVFLGDIFHKL